MAHRVHVLVLLGLGVLVPPARADEPKSAEATPSFSGHWTFDPEASDDPRAKMKEAMGDRMGRGGGRPGGGGHGAGGGSGGGGGYGGHGAGGGYGGGHGSGGGGGPMGGQGGGYGGGGMSGHGGGGREGGEGLREAMDDTLHPSKELLISEDGPALEIVQDGDHVLHLYADGRKSKGSTGLERKTRWEADKLVTEMKVSGGYGPEVKITETWALALPSTQSVGVEVQPPPAEGVREPATTPRLVITTRLEGGRFDKPLELRRIYAREPAR